MTHLEELEQLLTTEREQDIVPFLQRLTPEEKKALRPGLTKLAAYYSAFVSPSPNTYTSRMTVPQARMLAVATFVCYDKAAFQRTNFHFTLFRERLLDNIISWYMPGWFNEWVQEMAEKEALPGDLDYWQLLELQAKEVLTLTPAMVVSRLPMAINGKHRLYEPARLFEFPATLSEHFWYLFEYPSNIHFSDNWTNSKKTGDTEPNWKGFILQYTGDGTIDRMRVLEECLQAVNRNFNKLQVGWFVDMLTLLKPSRAELEQLQPLLLQALNSPQSKAVNTALGYLKALAGDKQFNHQALLDHLPQVMATDKKNIITTALQILEKAAKTHPEIKQRACLELCAAFLSKDEDLQAKAAKLILQWADKHDVALREQLSQYSSSMLASTRSSLKDLLEEEQADVLPADPEVTARLPLIGDHNRIVTEDLVFFASQVFENNATWHFDLLPAMLLAAQDNITTETLLQLEPALQRAATVLKRPSGNMGLLDMTLAVFFLNYGKWMADNDAAYTARLNEVKQSQHWWRGRHEMPELEHWKTSRTESAVYAPHRKLLILALKKIREKDPLPLLSTPTHEPGWIAPEVLAQRLAMYQSAGVSPDSLDLQVAIARCARQDTGVALALVDKWPAGEYRQLLTFLLDAAAMPQGPFTLEDAWMQAGLTKAPQAIYEAFADFSYNRLPVSLLNGGFAWTTGGKPYLAYGKYNPEKRDYERYMSEELVMDITFPEGEILKGKSPLLQEYMNGVGEYFSVSISDVARLLLLTPNHPDVLLARVMKSCQRSSGFYEVNETGIVLNTLKTLHSLDIPPSEMMYLCIALSMLHADKTVKAYAAEYWSSRIPDHISSEKLGGTVGMQQRVGWAPMKRFTDLITTQTQISRQQNEALETLLTACLAVFSETPVKDLKKLLEVYGEVLAINNSRISNAAVIQLLTAWQGSSAVKKAVQQLLKRVVQA
ncbi:hypothetical protein SAMN04488128_101406 [Chitinophaga eiseniae]|uniref:HEAT repeat-containing protein n=1 Tax=Chitinophaga eiseniae TaxID=634771 RepID=A0A1T4L033_9BACT|nr:DUF6493 family protein [Chitinophaga eiseniae]SJZ47993.1 hypothetical protein SAMN04488128_101406 [Chitinophaga eiseniae]